MPLAAVYQPYQQIIPFPSTFHSHHNPVPLPIQITCQYQQQPFPPTIFRPFTHLPLLQPATYQIHSDVLSSILPSWNPLFNGRVGLTAESPLLLPVFSQSASHDHWLGHCSHAHSTASCHEKSLGYGAFGVVWAVRDPRNGVSVALKRIPSVFSSIISAKRAYRELFILRHLKHSNIISLVDFVCAENIAQFSDVSILTEFMDTDLHKIIVSPQPLTSDHVKLFFYQVLRGVKYLHSAGIIHRDLKPGNLLVNSNCLVKICDFGLARIEDPNCSYLTQEVITQYYRPPELLMGATRYSFSVDMWSCGCIFAELLSRRILFQASTPMQQLERIVEFLGTPHPGEMKQIPQDVMHYIQSVSVIHHSALNTITDCEEARLLLMGLLRWDPDSRLTAEQALQASYVESGRVRFHCTICSCCTKPLDFGGRNFCCVDEAVALQNLSCGVGSYDGILSTRALPSNQLEPVCGEKIGSDFDCQIHSIYEGKIKLWGLIQEYFAHDKRGVRVKLNPLATNYRAFVGGSGPCRNGLTHAGTVWR